MPSNHIQMWVKTKGSSLNCTNALQFATAALTKELRIAKVDEGRVNPSARLPLELLGCGLYPNSPLSLNCIL
jgi:hypothetical protein